MGQLRLLEAFEFSEWQDASRYRSCWQADRRHWAWFWLKRDISYQQMVERKVKGARWLSTGSSVHHLANADISSLFRAGYLFIRIAWVMAIGMSGFSGKRISIRPLSVLKPNQYPQSTPTHSISPGLEPWPT